MDIIEQLLLLSFVFTIGYGVIVAQTIALNRVFYKFVGYYSRAWALFSIAFTIAGGLRVWALIRLPIQIAQAQSKGALPANLTFEQKITIGLSMLVIALLILAFDRHRRDLLRLGVL